MEANKPTRRRGEYRTPAPKPDSSEKNVLRVMRAMIEEGKDLTMSGKPEVPALSARLGFDVDAKQRDRLMGRL